LGDVVFVDLPDEGATLEVKGKLGEVESTKSVSDLYAPIAGRVVAVNAALNESPELVNSDPYGAGWCARSPPPTRPRWTDCSTPRPTGN